MAKTKPGPLLCKAISKRPKVSVAGAVKDWPWWREGSRSKPQQVVDTVGAGDAFLSITAPIAAKGTDMDLVGLIGNAVGAMKVGTVGHRKSVEKIPLMKYITALLR